MIKFTSYSIFFLACIFMSGSELLAQKMLDQEYYDDGSLKSTEYQLGADYQRIEYYKCGMIKERFSMTDRKRNGKFFTWNEEGQILSEVEYEKNIPTGTWVIRDKNGNVLATAKFEDGKIKTASIWDESGNLIAHR